MEGKVMIRSTDELKNWNQKIYTTMKYFDGSDCSEIMEFLIF